MAAWHDLPAAQHAATTGDLGALIRSARIAAKLTLAEAGAVVGYSAATLSRYETGQLTDARAARRIAELLGVPGRLLDGDTGGQGVGEMRRRDVLTGAAGLALLPVTSATAATEGLGAAVFAPGDAAPVGLDVLAAQIAAARADFHGVRFQELAARLPGLLATVAATRADKPSAEVERLAADAFNIGVNLLTKLHETGMAWSLADRALTAARASGDPYTIAESTRLAAIVMRRTEHRDGASQLLIQGADQLAAHTGLAGQLHAGVYARMLATAAYTAAVAEDRPTAEGLLAEALTAAERAPQVAAGFGPLGVASYRISVARRLGDFGRAVEAAALVDPASIPTADARARYWEDVALAFWGRGRPESAYRALLSAEAAAPQEVRFRPWAQDLTLSLLRTDVRGAMPGLRNFADRVGVAA